MRYRGAQWFLTGVRRYSTSNDRNIGFLGLGNMGGFMAANLVKKGFKVRGYDPSAEAMKKADKNGVIGANSVAEAIDGADVVISMLPDDKVVLETYLGKDGVIERTRKGALLIESSTVAPTLPRQLFPLALEKGKRFTDSPVSGGVMGAERGALAIMSGGHKEDFERALPIFKAMSTNQFYCGDIGTGIIAKLTNNLILFINSLAATECLNMGISAGIDPKLLLNIINSSTGRSWFTEEYCPVPGLIPTAPSSRDYKNGFNNDLMVKDLELACSMALNVRSPVPLGVLTAQVYRIMQILGYGQKDFTYLYQIMRGEASKHKN
ncbi:unnamed protein product [Arctia plantaginis]|uniref:3-hydroxyisobutyrate dehydrogenase n=1 Tax=Arctia plantaginis TaxID=874455 RepID=A0A8S1B5N4_ARCPL|nr:unnamed protein product [Arctia plantaginis]